jgi:predicted dehydrogenase
MKRTKIRYGVVGLGHIAQNAVLPAFKHASKNSKLMALISEDQKKLDELSKIYKIDNCFYLSELEDCLRSGEIDVLYVCTPNDTHREIVELAAKYGIHVLCEKPMAVSEEDCERMSTAAEKNKIKLMIAYRLHFESANLEAIKICRSGKIGELKYFNSTFSYQVNKGNIRLNKTSDGGGPVYDIGIYCINAARALFSAEPTEVMAFKTKGEDSRFTKSEETMSVMLKFPEDRLASFTVSFGAFESGDFDILGTKGRLCLEHAYEYTEPMTMTLYEKGKIKSAKKSVRTFKKRDQFAAELLYFSNCIIHNRTPEPGPREGLADVRIIEAIHKSASLRKPITLESFIKKGRPSKRQEIIRSPVKRKKMVHVKAPHN